MKPMNASLSVLAVFISILTMGTAFCWAQSGGERIQENTKTIKTGQHNQDGRNSLMQRAATPRFDVRRLERQNKILNRIQDSRSFNKKLQSARQQSAQFERKEAASKEIPMKKATLLGRPTGFLEAPVFDSRMVPSGRATVSSSNFLVNGATRDTVFIGDPLTLTFAFAPNVVSATLTILLDVNHNGIADSSDIHLTDILLMDNDDTDANPDAGFYSLNLQGYLGNIVGTFVFELNDYVAISSVEVTVCQKPQRGLLLGTISPPFADMAVEIVSWPTYTVVFSDTNGHFSSSVDPGNSNIISVYGPYDVTGVSNGYVPPSGHTLSITADTTNVTLVLSQASSFIEGYVRDQAGVGVVGVGVNASGPGFPMLTKTDETGHFKIGASAGSWYLQLSQLTSSEYLEILPAYRYFEVPANTTVQQNFGLVHANSTISGNVTLSGQGIGGVFINTFSDSLSNTVLTSVGGIYSLPVYNSSTTALKYTVVASMQDVEGYYFATPSLSNISPGSVNVDFAVTKVGGGIKGRIIDEGTGAAIADAQIYISGTASKSIVSNDSGYYKTSLLDGTYSMNVYADRYYSYSSPTFTIAGSILSRNIALWRSGSISGIVTGDDDKPISNAYVEVFDTSGNYRGYGHTDFDGGYMVSGLSTADYKVRCWRTGYINTWYDNAAQWYQAIAVRVNDGFDTPNIDFVLSRGGSISGNVKDRSGNPITNAYVEVLDSTFYYVTYVMTDDSGNYTATGLVTGDYFVKTYTELYFDQWYNNADSPDKATMVRVVINQNVPNVNFLLLKGGTISGRVMTKQHIAVPYASISVLDSTFSSIAYAYTYDTASYTISKLRPGIKLFVLASAYGYANRWYDNVSGPDSATALVLQEGETKADVNFTLSLAGMISGRIRDRHGNPVSYSYVSALDKMGNYVGYGYADYQGMYQITNLSTGTYFATANYYGYEQQWYDHKRTLIEADSIRVVEEQTVPNVDFDLLPPPGVENTVSIAEARKDVNNDLVPDHFVTQDVLAVCGVVTTPNLQAGIAQISYFIQDSSAGINVFYPGWSTTTFAIGDSVVVVGTVNQYQGLTELLPRSMNPDDFGILRHNAKVPRPIRVTPHQFVTNAETYEGQLVQIDSLYKLSGSWPVTGSNGSVYLVNSGRSDTIRMFIDWDTNIDGSAEPGYPINVKGVASQFSSSWAVNNGYEIVPRSTGDITPDSIYTGVEAPTNEIPTEFRLYSNYPNPFNPTTTIAFDLPKSSFASLKVFNLLGQEVATIVSSNLQAGTYRYRLDANRLSSGVYIYQLRAGEFIQTKKMIFMK